MSTPRGPSIIPVLRYHDAPGAIEWLCKAFGFEKLLVVPGQAGEIIHAQLTCGKGMIMLSSVRDDGIKPPVDVGANTQSSYTVVDDIGTHHDRAKAAGAVILLDVEDEDRGRVYTCTDPEGHLWSFGIYDPWPGA